MKKSILTIAVLLIASIGFAQPTPLGKNRIVNNIEKAEVVNITNDSTEIVKTKIPVDTTISVQMNINQFRQLLFAIDQNVDSKKISKELLEFLQKSAQIVQPADKAKLVTEIKSKN